MGIGGRAKGLAKVAVPTGIAGVSGVIEWMVVGDSSVPPLAPVNLLHGLGSIVNLPDLKLEFRKIGKETKNGEVADGA
eukprot:9128954-Lingulodinium_polyedra.AAC.1